MLDIFSAEEDLDIITCWGSWIWSGKVLSFWPWRQDEVIQIQHYQQCSNIFTYSSTFGTNILEQKQRISRRRLRWFPQGLRWKQLRPLRCWASNWGRLPSSCIPGLQQKHPKNSISSKTKLYFSLPCLQYFPISYRAVNGRCTGGGLLEIYLWIFGDTCDNVFIQFWRKTSFI